ncbi:hypothetical protein QF037_006630 [Streptomyces canus]|uniref:hypothetical protein n=1 Tax=Streptomyces canus TaxID=58343 RepID=UPI00278AE4B3|nr:hypothetical protein [Streptomyces canus]MDQ0602285.1 hypothetical protein [Streptomyces canus]
MPDTSTFDDYLNSLTRLTEHVDPTLDTFDSALIKQAGNSLDSLPEISRESLALWVSTHSDWGHVLGLAVGLPQEKFKNNLKQLFGTSGWVTLARRSPDELVKKLDEEFGLVAAIEAQRGRSYSFGDLLAERGGGRRSAARAGNSGRSLEDRIEEIAKELGLQYSVRTRFVGVGNQTAPCDLVLPNGLNAEIAVAAKGFDSTGSKLTDAVREIKEMADVRMPRQFIFAVVDGIGWLSRQADLRSLHQLWMERKIDGLYNVASLAQFRDDLEDAARRTRLL